MKLPSFCLLGFALMVFPLLAPNAYADTLNTANPFAVLGGAGVTNAGVGVLGATVITGNLGGSPGTPAVTGFPPGIVNGVLYLAGAPGTAFTDLSTAFGNLATQGIAGTPEGQLAGLNLGPGVYNVAAIAATSGGNLSAGGMLSLHDGGVGGSVFIFFMPSTLITLADSSVNVSGLQPNDQLFWVVGSSATLGKNTDFAGNILALASIGFDTGATDLCGRALAQTGSVTFAGQNAASSEENQVSIDSASCQALGVEGSGGGGLNGGPPIVIPSPSVVTPEPGTLLFLASGLVGLFGVARKRLARTLSVVPFSG